MASKRQLVLTRPAASTRADGGMDPLGPYKDVIGILAKFNTAPDGSGKRSSGIEVLYGPGMSMQVPVNTPQVTQAMVTVTDEDIAWPVLQRLCKVQGWKLVDLESGRSFG